jgi:predicted membrane protein
MNFRQRLLGLFASEGNRVIFLFLGTLFLLGTVLVLLATVAAAYTGDWSLPGLVATFMLFILLRTLLFSVPILIGIIMVWTGYKVLFKKRSKKGKNEASPNGEQLGRN